MATTAEIPRKGPISHPPIRHPANVARMSLDNSRSAPGLPPVHEAWLPREHSLHRPRHARRQLTALICALVFFTSPTVMWLFGMRPVELENHELASFPNPLSGWGFFTGMDLWATDNLVFRADAIEAADWASRTFFGESAPFDQGNTTPSGPLPGSPEEPARPGAPDEEDPATAGFRRVIEGKDGWLYFGEDVIAKCQPEQSIDSTVQRLADLRAAVEASGRKFILVAVPDKTTMVPEYLPDRYPGQECARKATPNLWQQLSAVPRAVDMRPPLQAVTDELGRPVFHPLDSHWTSEGAMEMVRQAAERVEPGVSDDWRVDRSGTSTGTSDLPPLIGREGTNRSTSYELRPNGRTDRTANHLDDLREPVRRSSRPLAGMVDKPTLLLGDSFSLAASRYMPAAFADVTQLYYSTAASDPGVVVDAMGDNEVVIVEIVERNIAEGALQMYDPAFIEQVREELQKRPIS